MITEFKIDIPTYVTLPRKTKADKKIYLNLNAYRNLHHSVESQCKKEFFKSLESKLKGISIQTPVEVTFRYYKPSKRISDKSNVYAIASKYLFDALTGYGCIEDDNDNFIKTETQLPTIHDKENPRFEFTFKSI